VTSVFERWRVTFVCLFLAVWSWSLDAIAQEDGEGDGDTRTAARALAVQGAAAFEQRDFEHALVLFERAGAIIPAPTITLMEARTLVELGRLVEALERYGATEHMLALDPSNEAYRDAAEAAQRETQPLLERIPTLRIRVGGALAGETLAITLDQKSVPPALAAMDRPIDPGPHRVDVHTSRGRSTGREFTLGEGAHEDIELTLAPLAPAPAPVPAPHARGSNRANTAGWALVISGAALTGVGTLTGVMALDHKSDLDAACTPGCPPSSSTTLDAYRRERTLSYATFVTGAVALAGGTYLVLTHPKRHLALYMTPNLVAVGGSFR
jgi:hypothetical protein